MMTVSVCSALVFVAYSNFEPCCADTTTIYTSLLSYLFFVVVSVFFCRVFVLISGLMCWVETDTG